MRFLFLASGLLLAVPPVLADGFRNTPTEPTYTAECGSCHIAYPARLLSAPEWQVITARLDKHFGVDASLDDRTLQHINQWLSGHAAGQPRAGVQGDRLPRITESRWFRREHGELSASVWKRPAIKSPSNCGACHAGADKGVFAEHDVRIPR